MIEKIVQNLASSKFAKTISAFINNLPFPYARFPVKVYGHRMVVHKLDRYIALWLWRFGFLEASEVSLITRMCKPGTFAIDIGANVGLYALLLARHVGPAGHVWAFEPDLENLKSLRHNLKFNNYSNVTTVNAGVSAVSEQGYLYISDGHSGDHRIYQVNDRRSGKQVQMVALDDYFSGEQRIDLIKMDIQGAEGMALAGMKKILKNNFGLKILMEFCPADLRRAGSDPAQVLNDLQELGFVLKEFVEESESFRKVCDPADLIDSLTGNRYVNLLVGSGCE